MILTETTYGQAIQNEKELLESIRKDTIRAYKEFDEITSKVASQRVAKTEVTLETKTLSEKIGELQSVCKGIESDIKGRKRDFENLDEDEKKKLSKMKKNLRNLEKQVSIFEGKKSEIIDIDDVNKKTKSKMSYWGKKLQDTKEEIEKVRKEKEEFYKWKEKEEKRIAKLEQKNKDNAEALRIKLKDANVLNNRLKKQLKFKK